MVESVISQSGEQNHFPERYEDLPRFTESHILPLSSFSKERESYYNIQTLFQYYIAYAVRNPGWLTNDRFSNAEFKTQHGYPVDCDSINYLSSHATLEDLLSFAERMNRHDIHGFSGDFPADIMVRAIQLMSDDFPNLNFFRGANYVNRFLRRDEQYQLSKYTYSGFDFSPGCFFTAVDDYYSSPYAERKRPVLVVAPFSRVSSLYTIGSCSIATEGNWWRNSLEVHVKSNAQEKCCSLYLLPSTKKECDQLLVSSEFNSITVSEELLEMMKERIAQRRA